MNIKITPSNRIMRIELERDLIQPFTNRGGININFIKQYGIKYFLDKGFTENKIFQNIDKLNKK